MDKSVENPVENLTDLSTSSILHGHPVDNPVDKPVDNPMEDYNGRC